MRALAMNYNGDASINWNAEVSGVQMLKQKVIGNFMVRRGTDKIIPNRGTDLEKTVLGRGVPDVMFVQHQLNFAAVKARLDIQANTTGADAASSLKSFRLKLAGATGYRANVTIHLTNAAGDTLGSDITL